MNNTLHNGLRLLEYLSSNADAVSVKELAEHFQLPNSHICRLLKSLTETGYAEQLPGSRKYRISLKILKLANARLKKERLLELARPYLKQLAEKLDAPVFVSKFYCGYSLIIGTEYPPLFADTDKMAVGTLHSPTDSACGRICAAYADEDTQADLLDHIDWNSSADFRNQRALFETELAKIRQCGCALRDVPDGVGAVGVPLFESDGIFNGALGVMIPAGRVRTNELWQNVIEAAASCGKLISFAQGCSIDNYLIPNNSARRKK